MIPVPVAVPVPSCISPLASFPVVLGSSCLKDMLLPRGKCASEEDLQVPGKLYHIVYTKICRYSTGIHHSTFMHRTVQEHPVQYSNVQYRTVGGGALGGGGAGWGVVYTVMLYVTLEA